MKNTIRSTLVFIGLVLAGQAHAQDVQTINQEGTIKVDAVGHAAMSFKTEMSAMQWQNWMQSYGNAQHVLKRDMKSEFAMYHVDDFAISKNEGR